MNKEQKKRIRLHDKKILTGRRIYPQTSKQQPIYINEDGKEIYRTEGGSLIPNKFSCWKYWNNLINDNETNTSH